MIVVDTNVLAYLWIRGPLSEASSELLERDDDWHAPSLWRSEFRNVLVNHLRAGAASFEACLAAMEGAGEQMREKTLEVDSVEVLRLARDSKCSAYDCEFVALAKRLGVPLVTSDRKLARAFPDLTRLLGDVKERS